jgi:uncharacterized linocin/CFP29 family protein
MAELSWTDAQWQKVNDAVTEAFSKASVASAFLPCYGPLSGGTETVRNERLQQEDATVRLETDHDSLNLRFVTLRVHVDLSTEQVSDETMGNALLVFRRAANILAQEEDRIVFDGFERGADDHPEFVANHPRPQKGLADPLERMRFEFITTTGMSPGQIGNAVVPAVVAAIQILEDASNPSPFACILGNTLFEAVHTPDRASLVLPADRITPIVNGPLLRSGKMNAFTGIVVSLAASAVDIVVGTPPTVQFLQRTIEGRFQFRVYERFVLRLRDDGDRLPVAGFTTGDIDSALQAVRGAAIKTKNAKMALNDATGKITDAIDHVVEAAKH